MTSSWIRGFGGRVGVALLSLGISVAGMAPTLQAQVLDNKGTEFIVGFLPNYSPGNIEIHLTADSATTATVQYPVNSPTFTSTVNVTPGLVTIVSLPSTAGSAWPAGTVANNAVRVSSPLEVVAYLINRAPFTSDAGLGLPVDALNTDYIVATYAGGIAGTDFVVVAAFDATTVTITPRAAITGGSGVNVPITRLLNRGQGFLASSSGDLTGSVVSADKPVAVTNGNRCAQIPPGFAYCDHTFEVAHPIQSWGNDVLVANLPNRSGGSIYRVLASQAATAVTLDGVALTTLAANQFYETPRTTGSHRFAANNPIFVLQYMTGSTNPGAIIGDPAMANMIPAEQYQSRYTFSTVGGSQFVQNFVTIIAQNTDVGTLLLDGLPVAAGSFAPIGSSGFSSAVLALTQGTHTTSSTSPHGITVEGYNQDDSYEYPGGALFQFINPVGDANPPICTGQIASGSLAGSAVDNRVSEDSNGNNVLDPGEDLNANGVIDEDTGIFFVQLDPGALNVSLSVAPFVPATKLPVAFNASATNPALLSVGAVRATDGAGNTCSLDVQLGTFDPDGDVTRTNTRNMSLRLGRPSPGTSGARCVETTPPADPIFGDIPYTPFTGDTADVPVSLSAGNGQKLVCCEFLTGTTVSAPFCENVVLEEASPACDVDADGNIDIDDVNRIMSARGTRSSGPGDARDADADGNITVNDGRLCVLRCNLAKCQRL